MTEARAPSAVLRRRHTGKTVGLNHDRLMQSVRDTRASTSSSFSAVSFTLNRALIKSKQSLSRTLSEPE